MKIVVLDGFTINPGDLSWNELKSVGDCTIYDRSAAETVLDRSTGAEILLTNKTVLGKNIIESLPNLKYIGVLATGYNVVDIEAAKSRNIIVTNIPAYGAPSVAQATFALLLELTNHVGYHNSTVHGGQWSRSIDFCYWDRPLVELAGLIMGLIGFGSIGQAVARLAKAFGMKVLVHTRSKRPTADLLDIDFCSLDDIFTHADVVSLHCPLTAETKELVNADRLSQMKSSAILLNTGRGPLIDEVALSQALKSGRIAGAGLDVLTVEPPTTNHPLFNCPNCIITPHIAWATFSARQRLLNTAVQNLKNYIAGHPTNVVN